MSLQQETETLRNIPMFSTIDPARLKLLSFTSERVSYMPGEEFINRGAVWTYLTTDEPFPNLVHRLSRGIRDLAAMYMFGR